MRRNTNLRLLLVAILSSVVAERGSTQTSAADGPWAGWAQCQLTAQGQGYANQQTHTWVLTGTTPTVEGAFRLYPATWTVAGQGSRQRVMGDGRTVVEQWTTAGPPRPAPISVWIRGSDATLRFTSRHAQLRSQGAATGTSTARSTNGNVPDQTTQIGYDVYEWTFPAIEDVPAKTTTVSGSPGPRPLTGSIAPGQPPGTSLTEACSWQFVQGALVATQPPLPPSISTAAATVTATAKSTTLSSAGSVKPIQTVAAQPTPTTGALPTISPSSPISGAALPTTTSDPSTATLSTAPAGPAPVGVVISGTPSTATLSWQPPAGVTGYQVLRSSSVNTSWATLTPTPLTSTRFTDLSGGFDSRVKLTYRVVSLFAQGPAGAAEVQFQPPVPPNPAWARADVSGTNIVVSWAPVPGVARYSVAGQSATDWRDVPATLTSVTYYNVPAGSYEWRVGAVFDPGGVQSPVTQWALASISTAVTSGKYRVSIAGFQVNSATYEGLIERDGKGDEVFAAAIVTQVDRRNGQISRNELVQSVVHGDASFPNRENAGSASPTGGLWTSDIVPAGWYPTAASPAPRLPGRLPLSLWEGTLQDATDAVVIRPTLWEGDGDAYSFNQWRDYALGRSGNVWLAFGQVDAPKLTLSVLRDTRSPMWHYCCRGDQGYQLQPGEMRGGWDRLIGLDGYYQDPNYYNYSKYYWSDRIVVVTREKIEAALNNPNTQQLAPGVVAISLIDGPTSDPFRLGANYVLYLRVERIP